MFLLKTKGNMLQPKVNPKKETPIATTGALNTTIG